MIREYPETFAEVMKGKKGMDPALPLEIAQAPDLEEEYLAILQAFYVMKEEKLRQRSVSGTPGLSKGRLEEEKAEIKNFYGDQVFNRIGRALKVQHA